MCNYNYRASSNCRLIDDLFWQSVIMSLCTLIQGLGIYDILPEMCDREKMKRKKEMMKLWIIKQKVMVIFLHCKDVSKTF